MIHQVIGRDESKLLVRYVLKSIFDYSLILIYAIIKIIFKSLLHELNQRIDRYNLKEHHFARVE